MKKQKGQVTENNTLEEKIIDLETKLKFALADYQNLAKEVENQKLLRERIIKKNVFSDLIDIFTDLFIALESLPKELIDNPSIRGLIHIIEKYKTLLNNHGVEQINFIVGADYDSETSEVIGTVLSEENVGKVAQVVQPGYKIQEMVIKPAKVLIFQKQ